MNEQELTKHIVFRMAIYILIMICFLLSLIAILVIPVKAVEQTTDISNDIWSSTLSVCGSGHGYKKYCAIDNNNTSYVRQVATTYTGVLQCIDFSFDYNFMNSRDYIISIETNDNDFRNNNINYYYSSYTTYPSNETYYNVQGRFISNKKIQLVLPYNPQATHRIQVCGSPLTGISNYNIKSVYLTYDDGNQDLTGIIDNATQNTTDIINNNNSNFESLFDLDRVISQDNINTSRSTLENMCSNSYSLNLQKGKRITTSSDVDDPLSFYTDYIDVSGATSVCFQNSGNSSSDIGGDYWFITYNSNKTLVGVFDSFKRCVPINSNIKYFRVSTKYPGILITKNSYCEKAEEQINSYLRDDTDPSVNQQGIDNALSSVDYSNPLDYLLTLPTHLLQKINTVLSANSCSRVSFGSLYGTELYLPCIDFASLLGSSIWNTIDLFVGVALLAMIIKHFYESISNIITLGKEKEVQSKLDLPTPMQFLASILGGGKS